MRQHYHLLNNQSAIAGSLDQVASLDNIYQRDEMLSEKLVSYANENSPLAKLICLSVKTGELLGNIYLAFRGRR